MGTWFRVVYRTNGQTREALIRPAGVFDFGNRLQMLSNAPSATCEVLSIVQCGDPEATPDVQF